MVFLHVDVDPRKGKDLWEERGLILKKLEKFEPRPTCVVFSGGGYQAFWRLAEPVEINGKEELYEDAKRYNLQLERVLGGDSCHNVDRIMRLPGTVNRPDWKKLEKGRTEELAKVIWQEDTVCDLGQFTAAPLVQEAGFASKVQVSGNVDRVLDLLGDERLARVGDSTKRIIAQGDDPDDPTRWGGDRSKALWHVVCALVRAGVDDDTIYAIVTDPAWDISAHVLDQRDPHGCAIRQIERARDEEVDEFEVDKNNVPYPTQRNVRRALTKLGVVLEHDEFADRSLVTGLEGFGPHLDDKAVSRLWLALEEKFRLKVGKDKFWTIVADLALQNSRHPVREYLDGLEWDGEPRIDRWLVDYLGAEDGDYVRAVGRIVLLAAVRRVRKPGCKFDEMPVLEGAQGGFKSMAIATLAVRAAWFSDDLPLNAKTQAFIEATTGKWIVEAGELKGMRKGDVESLKACLSRQTDRARMAYGRLPVERCRQFVLIGTTNSERYLRDNTGNRRFWPVRVGDVNLTALRRDIDQLWAEAAARESDGESIRLDEALWAAAGEHQEARRVEDPFLDRLRDMLGDLEGKLPTEEAWKVVGVQPGNRTQDHNTRLGDAMRELGWTKKRLRLEGALTYCYVRGDESEWLVAVMDEDDRKCLRVGPRVC